MRILMLSNWLPPVPAGSAFYTSSLAQALAARGNEIILVTLDWGPSYLPDQALPFPVYRLPVIRIPKLPIFYNLDLMGFACTPANHRRLASLVRRHQPDVLHQVNHIFDTTFLATNVGRSQRVPVVGSITTPIQHQRWWVQCLMELADRLIVGPFGVRRWDRIVSLDQVVHDYVGRVYGGQAKGRSVVIPFGVPIESLAQYVVRRPLSDRPQILFVGHIHPFRNPVQLVRAMPHVLERVPNARLVLAGRIDLTEPVSAARALGLTPDQVEFLGVTPHDRVVELMQTSHVFASWVTGPYHSLGTAPMESMLCETPVVNDLSQDAFGKGLLKNGENIVLVDSRDPESIADGVVRLLVDEGFRQAVGAGGRRFVLEHLSWDRIAAQMEQCYEQVLNQ